MAQARTITPTKGKAVPTDVRPSQQYDLFTKFLGKASDLSNTIELWDIIPKYAVSARKQVALRDDKGRLPVYRQQFVYRPTGRSGNPIEAEIRLQPASVEIDGVDRDCYPSANEELLEEVLRKLFSDQAYGMHEARSLESWVTFTLYAVRQELKARGHTRSHEEIRRSLEIMGRCNVEVSLRDRSEKSQTVYSAPILADLTRNGRDSYLADPKSRWAARLPALVSQSINKVNYRQFNYATLMELPNPLARWMHKRLSHKYTNAGYNHPYSILYSSIERDSGMLVHIKPDRNRKSVAAMWEALKKHRVVMNVKIHEGAGEEGNDIRYEVFPTPDFVGEVKAANARQRDSKSSLHLS